MKKEMNIEELLNSYIDGELSVRQRTEVKRMAVNDPDIAKRLKQLQKCRLLVSALPIAHAPAHIMQNVRASLEARANTDVNMPVYASGKTEKTRFILLHRVLAAAAVIAIAAVMVLVINMLTPPITDNEGGRNLVAADIRFSGRLELKTNDLKAVNSVVNRAIKNSGFAESAEPLKDSNRYVYTLNCSREGLNKVLAELNDNWDKLNSAVFFVDTKIFSRSVEIEGITPSQIAEIVNQKDNDDSVKMAKDVAVANSVDNILPKSNIYSSSGDVRSSIFKIQPIFTKNYQSTRQENGQKTVQLRIIVSR